MALELNQLRFALDFYDHAETDEAREDARILLLGLVTVGLLRTLIAALDETLERLEECEDG